MPQKLTSLYLDSIDLPEGIDWYEVDGRKLFVIRDIEGKDKTNLIAYLMLSQKDKGAYRFGIEFTDEELTDTSLAYEKIQKALKEFVEKIEASEKKFFDKMFAPSN